MPKQTYLNLCEIFDKNEKDVNEFLIQNNLNNSDLTYSRLNKLIKKKNKFYNFAIHSPLKTTKSIQSNGISVLVLFSGAGGFSLDLRRKV